MPKRSARLFRTGAPVHAMAFVTPRGKVYPAYDETVVGHVPGYIVVRNDEHGVKRCHEARELIRLPSKPRVVS